VSLFTCDPTNEVRGRMFRRPKNEELFTPVLFVTLTRPNLPNWFGLSSDEKAGVRILQRKRLCADVRRFGGVLSRRVKCHLDATAMGGRYDRNPHLHSILEVPNDELGRFESRIGSFKPELMTRFDFDFVRWSPILDGGGGSYLYVKNHPEHERFSFCPRQRTSCRKGRCPHFS
jgi:hypothetical protein